MQTPASPHGIVLVTELHRLDIDDRPFRRAAARGDAVRIHRGAYMSAAEWHSLDRHERYRRQVIAAALASRSNPVISHQSAAALWGIPIIGEWPQVVHVLTTPAAGTRTENGFRRHAVQIRDADVVESDGVRCTSLARTLIDLACETSFASAVAGLDWSLRAPTRGAAPRIRMEELQHHAAERGLTRNRRKVRRALEFANPLAETPGESLSRVVIHELGFPAPELQVEVEDARGLIGVSDFAWPEARLLGEFDGLVKYTRNLARPGRGSSRSSFERRLARIGCVPWDEGWRVGSGRTRCRPGRSTTVCGRPACRRADAGRCDASRAGTSAPSGRGGPRWLPAPAP